VVKGLAWDSDKPCYSGRSVVFLFQVKRNGKHSKMEIKFNEKILSCGISRWKIYWWIEISGSW
jgi:hypothetical protein